MKDKTTQYSRNEAIISVPVIFVVHEWLGACRNKPHLESLNNEWVMIAISD